MTLFSGLISLSIVPAIGYSPTFIRPCAHNHVIAHLLPNYEGIEHCAVTNATNRQTATRRWQVLFCLLRGTLCSMSQPTPRHAKSFGLRFRGYDTELVDAAVTELAQKAAELQTQLSQRDNRVGELEGMLDLQREELEFLRMRQARVDELLTTAQDEASQIVQRAQSESEHLLTRATDAADAVVRRRRAELQQLQERVDSLAAVRAQITRSIMGSINHVERAAIDMREGLANIATGPSPDRVTATLGASQEAISGTGAPRTIAKKPPTTIAGGTLDRSDSAHVVPLAKRRFAQTKGTPSTSSGTAQPVASMRIRADVVPNSTVVLEVTPISSYADLAAFERWLNDVESIDSVYVKDFNGEVAELELTLGDPATLLVNLRSTLPKGHELDATDPTRIRAILPNTANIV